MAQRHSLLVEQITDCEHNPIGGGGAQVVLRSLHVTLTVHEVIGVLSVFIGEQGVTRDLLVEAPVLAEEVGQVLDVDSQLEGVFGPATFDAT